MTFTSTKVPKFAGVTGSIPAGVRCHRTVEWMGRRDRCTAVALSFGGDALNVALLVPASRGVASRAGGRTVGPLRIAGATGRLSPTI